MNMLLLLSLLLLLLSLLLLSSLLLLFFISLLMLIKHGIILIYTLHTCATPYSCTIFTAHIHTHRWREREHFWIKTLCLFSTNFSVSRALKWVSLSPVSIQNSKCRSFVRLLLCVLVLAHNYVELNIFNGKLFNCLGQCRTIFVFMGTLESNWFSLRDWMWNEIKPNTTRSDFWESTLFVVELCGQNDGPRDFRPNAMVLHWLLQKYVVILKSHFCVLISVFICLLMISLSLSTPSECLL